MNGFSLHAAVRCGAKDRQPLEQQCRYMTCRALANERVQPNAAGQVVLKLKTPWRYGSTHLVLSPLEFMQRLAALVRPLRTGAVIRPPAQAAPQWRSRAPAQYSGQLLDDVCQCQV